MNCATVENNMAHVACFFSLFFLFPLARIDIFVAVNNLLQSTTQPPPALEKCECKPLLATDKGKYAGTCAARVNKTILLT